MTGKVIDFEAVRADALRLDAARRREEEPPPEAFLDDNHTDDDPGQADDDRPAWQRYGVLRMDEALRAVWEKCGTERKEQGIATGNGVLDRLTGGYRRERVTVLGAVTSWGKSSFAVMALDDADRIGKRVLLVSSEDSADTYGKRIASRRGNIDAIRLRDECLSQPELTTLSGIVDRASKAPWFLDGRGKTAESLATMVRNLCVEEQYDLVIIDYLQAFTARAQDRRNEVAKVMRLFADAIKTGGAAGLILSQIKRMEKGREPTMHDLKEAGEVENASEHVIIGLYSKNANGETRRCLQLEKNKDGPPHSGKIWLSFDSHTASFTTTTIDQYSEPETPESEGAFDGM